MQTTLFEMTYSQAVEHLCARYGFDFSAIGIAPEFGEALQWKYACGNTGERFRRIALTPGRGIGGIVLKTGRSMLLTDIDNQLDPRDFSSYPIVFAEDLRSFCCLPLSDGVHVIGAVLCGFRTVEESHEAAFKQLIEDTRDGLCGFSVPQGDVLNFAELSGANAHGQADIQDGELAFNRIQEEERRRLARELHDGLAQELFSVSMLVRKISTLHPDDETQELTNTANAQIKRVLDDIHNLSVELRPLALDDLGLQAGTRSQASLYQKSFGVEIIVVDNTDGMRFDPYFETHAYRITQEALLNACKYSGSELVRITFNTIDNNLVITICDEGFGFDTTHPTVQGTGGGLPGMRERARIINGTLLIDSDEGGTCITLRAPIALEE